MFGDFYHRCCGLLLLVAAAAVAFVRGPLSLYADGTRLVLGAAVRSVMHFCPLATAVVVSSAVVDWGCGYTSMALHFDQRSSTLPRFTVAHGRRLLPQLLRAAASGGGCCGGACERSLELQLLCLLSTGLLSNCTVLRINLMGNMCV